MCFLLLHHLTRDDAPLVLLANRDEEFGRPFEGPALRDEARGIWAPQDLRAGGTWLGLNGHGLVVAITNRGRGRFGGVRSRGGLVSDALRAANADAAVAWVREHLKGTAYAGFNLLMADAEAAWVVRHPGAEGARPPTTVDVVRLPPGAHVLSNLHDLDEVPIPDAGLPTPEAPLGETLARLRRLAQDDTTVLPDDHRILKRGDGGGTVCSALLAFGADGQKPLFEFANGVPSEVPFEPVAL